MKNPFLSTSRFIAFYCVCCPCRLAPFAAQFSLLDFRLLCCVCYLRRSISIMRSMHMKISTLLSAYYSHVFCLFAGTSKTPPLRSNSLISLLQESHVGTMYSPDTLLLIICAPSVAVLVQLRIEHTNGQGFFELLIQCSLQDPQLHERFAVPFLFFHPLAVMLIQTSPSTTILQFCAPLRTNFP